MRDALTASLGKWRRTLRLRLGHKPTLATYEVGGRSFTYRPQSYDKFVIDEVWKGDEYFLEHAAIHAGEWIIDIGAHIGAFAIKAHAQFTGAPIIAIEPEPANYRLLRRNLAQNRCSAVTALNVAILDESGKTNVYVDPTNTAGHSTAMKVSANGIPTNALSLTDLVEKYAVTRIGLVKIDCEGAEYEILLGHSFAAICDRVANLVFEYHPIEGRDFGQVCTALNAHGFRMTAHKDGYLPGQGTALFQRADPGGDHDVGWKVKEHAVER